jgi:hypothetical protein
MTTFNRHKMLWNVHKRGNHWGLRKRLRWHFTVIYLDLFAMFGVKHWRYYYAYIINKMNDCGD